MSIRIKDTFKRLLSVIFAFCISNIYVNGAKAGEEISFGISTRMIFHSDEKRISIPAKNSSKKPLVFHGQVLDASRTKFSPDFIMGPEIIHLGIGEEKRVQIIKINGHFPEDRESLYYLKGHFLPAEVFEGRDAVRMNISYSIVMKLFHRPVSLKAKFDAIDENADKLDFKVVNSTLEVTNKSPYFVTINTLKSNLGTIHVPDGKSMIDPFGKQIFEISKNKLETITWTLLNDGGFATEPVTRNL